MTKREIPKLFEDKKIRTVWDDEEEKWYFSIVDVVGALTDQPDVEHARNYWKVLKHRLKKEGNESVTNCNQLKLRASDGFCLGGRYRLYYAEKLLSVCHIGFIALTITCS